MLILVILQTAIILFLIVDRSKKFPKLVEQRVSERITGLMEMVTHFEQAAITDALTGLLNRRGGEEAISKHIARTRRLNGRFSLIVLDIDNFKQVNDRYGHSMGDMVISGIANTVRKNLRDADFAIRWGGEEFLICLPDTDLVGATCVAEKLRCAIEQIEFEFLKATASFGCAELGSDDFQVAIARADMHLYMAKSKGRNCVFPRIE